MTPTPAGPRQAASPGSARRHMPDRGRADTAVVKLWHLGAAVLIVGYFAYFLYTHTSGDSLEDERDQALEIADQWRPSSRRMGSRSTRGHGQASAVPPAGVRLGCDVGPRHQEPRCMYIDVDAFASERTRSGEPTARRSRTSCARPARICSRRLA